MKAKLMIHSVGLNDVFILFLCLCLSIISCNLWKFPKKPVGIYMEYMSHCITVSFRASLSLRCWGFNHSSEKEAILSLSVPCCVCSCLNWMATGWLILETVINQCSFLICSYFSHRVLQLSLSKCADTVGCLTLWIINPQLWQFYLNINTIFSCIIIRQ